MKMSRRAIATSRKIKKKITIHEKLETCRLCLIDRAVHNIFDGDLTIILDEILSYCQLKPFKNDGLPQHVCKICLKESTRIAKFIKLCKENDKLYRENLMLATVEVVNVKSELKEEPEESHGYSEEYGFSQVNNDYDKEMYSDLCSKENKIDIEEVKLEKNDVDSEERDSFIHLNTKSNKKTECSLSKKAEPKVKKKYVRSKKRNSDKTTKLCQICGKVFLHSSSYRHHIKLHSGERFVCSICEKTFRTKAQMTQHYKLHFPSETSPCQICGKFFNAKYLKSHMRVFHERKQQMMCEICNKVLNTATSYSVHMKVHRGEKRYECDICKKKFTQKCVLIIHIRSHTGEKPYACSYCDNRFSSQKSCQRHTRLHTGERPYICPVCAKGFMQSSNLKSHVKNNHKEFDLKDLRRV